MTELQGVFVVAVTPMNAAGAVDWTGLRSNVEWWIEEGVHGVLPLGSTGEFASLSEEERFRIAETVLDVVDGRVPVVVGATSETTEGALKFARHAEKSGAQGVLVLPPFFYRCTQSEIYYHYASISREVELPVMIYNNPRSAKVDILPETVCRLYRELGMNYIKESSNDIKRITELRTVTEDGINIFCGCEHMAYESFLMEAIGWVSVIANVAPRMAVKLYESVVKDHDLETGWEVYRRLLPLLRYFEGAGRTQRALKHILDSRGLAGGGVRRPKDPLTGEEKDLISSLYKGLE